jgi:hypothetical protein
MRATGAWSVFCGLFRDGGGTGLTDNLLTDGAAHKAAATPLNNLLLLHAGRSGYRHG